MRAGANDSSGHMVLRPQREAIVSSLFVSAIFANRRQYCATKAAVLHLTRALAVEFAEHNIQVNSVSPGCVTRSMLIGRG